MTLVLFYLTFFFLFFFRWDRIFGSKFRVRESDTVQSETTIQLPRNFHPPMINPRREFRTPRLRYHIGSIPSRTPFFIDFFFSLEKRRAGMNGILFTTTLPLFEAIYFSFSDFFPSL